MKARVGEWWMDDKRIPLVCRSTDGSCYGFAYGPDRPIAVSVPKEDLGIFWEPVVDREGRASEA